MRPARAVVPTYARAASMLPCACAALPPARGWILLCGLMASAALVSAQFGFGRVRHPHGAGGAARPLLHDLPDHVPERQERGGRRRLADRLSLRRQQPADPVLGADAGAGQQGRRPAAQPLRGAAHRRRALQLPLHGGVRRRHDGPARRRGPEAAAVPAQGRLPVGGRLLGHAGVGALVRRDPRGAARPPDRGRVDRRPDLPHASSW